ncbi:hypothetical protein BDN70DRAFT_930346 [Pholiota conissans]|uniref:Uncharacterized protein n=1 Tax=Pholiota conissans TaxID=109636 RepID=A0A9P5Z5Q5_9AGAR|nr:hypothetical protein BDN70DRAFT_930346 [Pholiota conissans]
MPRRSFHGIAPQPNPIGDYTAIVNISQTMHNYAAIYSLLDRRLFEARRDGHLDEQECQLTFAVFNFSTRAQKILVPTVCMAKCLECEERPGKVTPTGNCQFIDTKEPIVFDLKRTYDDPNSTPETDPEKYATKYDDDESDFIRILGTDFFLIDKDNLVKHGMQLLIMYL